jgi:hypothetical protein
MTDDTVASEAYSSVDTLLLECMHDILFTVNHFYLIAAYDLLVQTVLQMN